MSNRGGRPQILTPCFTKLFKDGVTAWYCLGCGWSNKGDHVERRDKHLANSRATTEPRKKDTCPKAEQWAKLKDNGWTVGRWNDLVAEAAQRVDNRAAAASRRAEDAAAAASGRALFPVTGSRGAGMPRGRTGAVRAQSTLAQAGFQIAHRDPEPTPALVEAVHLDIVKFLVGSCVPFSAAATPGFQLLVRRMNSHMADRKMVTPFRLDGAATRLAANVDAKAAEWWSSSRSVTVVFDGSTDVKSHKVTVVCASNRESSAIYTDAFYTDKPLSAEETADHVHRTLQSADAVGDVDKIAAFMSDNASVAQKTGDILSKTSPYKDLGVVFAGCGAHAVDLVAKALVKSGALPYYEDTISELTDTVGKIRHSSKWLGLLEKYMKQHGASGLRTTIPRPCITRWASVWRTCAAYILASKVDPRSEKSPLEKLAADMARDLPAYSDRLKSSVFVAKVRHLERLLRPVAALTQLLQGDRAGQAEVFQATLALQAALKRAAHDISEHNPERFDPLWEALDKVWQEKALRNLTVLAALCYVLDPRYRPQDGSTHNLADLGLKDLPAPKGSKHDNLEAHLAIEIHEAFAYPEYADKISPYIRQALAAKHGPKLLEWDKPKLLEMAQNMATTLFDQYSAYVNHRKGFIRTSIVWKQACRSDCNPIDWWENVTSLAPELAGLAQRLLSIAASSASAERMFSTLNLVHTKKRSALGTSKTNTYCKLRVNMHLLQDDTAATANAWYAIPELLPSNIDEALAKPPSRDAIFMFNEEELQRSNADIAAAVLEDADTHEQASAEGHHVAAAGAGAGAGAGAAAGRREVPVGGAPARAPARAPGPARRRAGVTAARREVPVGGAPRPPAPAGAGAGAGAAAAAARAAGCSFADGNICKIDDPAVALHNCNATPHCSARLHHLCMVEEAHIRGQSPELSQRYCFRHLPGGAGVPAAPAPPAPVPVAASALSLADRPPKRSRDQDCDESASESEFNELSASLLSADRDRVGDPPSHPGPCDVHPHVMHNAGGGRPEGCTCNIEIALCSYGDECRFRGQELNFGPATQIPRRGCATDGCKAVVHETCVKEVAIVKNLPRPTNGSHLLYCLDHIAALGRPGKRARPRQNYAMMGK